MSTQIHTQIATDAKLVRIVREGLMQESKSLPPWLFYDERGSLLFEQITRLPEYYLTRLERALLTEHAPGIVRAAANGSRLRIFELGAGSADKTRLLLAAAVAQQQRLHYHPIDVSASALAAARRRLNAELPAVDVNPILADYTSGWQPRRHEANERHLLLWLGSSIGNFEPESAQLLLAHIRKTMKPGDGLLLGVDLAPRHDGKAVSEVLAAYDDQSGMTAAFNRNILLRLNRELGAEFDADAFTHRAEWDVEKSRIEMHLESQCRQSVWIDALGKQIAFAEGERIHTENSYKYTLEAAEYRMQRAGFPCVARWLDEQGWFAVLLGAVADEPRYA